MATKRTKKPVRGQVKKVKATVVEPKGPPPVLAKITDPDIIDSPNDEPEDAEKLLKVLNADDEAIWERALKCRKGLDLDPLIEASFIRHVRRGRPLPWVCELLGFGQNVIHNWIQKANLYANNADDPMTDHLQRYYIFCMRLRRAHKEYMSEVLEEHRKGYQGEWVKFSWLLERLDPSIYGRRDPDRQGAVEDARSDVNEKFV